MTDEEIKKMLTSFEWRLVQIENTYRDGFYTQLEYINLLKEEIKLALTSINKTE